MIHGNKFDTELKTKAIDFLVNDRKFMAYNDATALLEHSTSISSADFRLMPNKEIYNYIIKNNNIIINDEAILVSIDANVKFLDDFPPKVSVSMSQLGRKPQTITHFAAQYPAYVTANIRKQKQSFAYLIPITQIYGTERVESNNTTDSGISVSDLKHLLHQTEKMNRSLEQMSADVNNTSKQVIDFIINAVPNNKDNI